MSKQTEQNDPNVNFGMYEQDREAKRESQTTSAPREAGERWQLDECEDANGFHTIRPFDGSANGDTSEHLIATVSNEANARLIASAPDLLAENARLREVNAELLAALKFAANQIDTLTDYNGGMEQTCYTTAERAAIAKAEKEAQ